MKFSNWKKKINKGKSLSLFHINAYYLNKNFDDLEYLLKCVNQQLDVVAVTENRITRNAP